MKIRIATPSLSGITNNFKLFVDRIMSIKGYHWSFREVVGISDIDEARNQCIGDLEFDKILFIDDDINCDISVIAEMLVLNESVVSVVYPLRNNQNKFSCGDEYFDNDTLDSFSDSYKKWSGLGLTLIDRSVLESIGKPYIRRVCWGDRQLGEDVSFCYNATERKFNIYCFYDNSIKHKKEVLTMPEQKTVNLDSIAMSVNRSVLELINYIHQRDQHIAILNNKIKSLENQLLDLKIDNGSSRKTTAPIDSTT